MSFKSVAPSVAYKPPEDKSADEHSPGAVGG